jgi:6-pyruvoyltetrahydropterin/6-carboxytetrahydropterin synthase
MTLTRVYHFSAGHRLENPALGADENARLYGACARPHGHNYYVEVTVAGQPDPVTGMLVDVARVDEVVQREVLDQVDHRTLEDVEALRGVITTGESLARVFWRRLAPALGLVRLEQVVVVETAKNRFEYRGAA